MSLDTPPSHWHKSSRCDTESCIEMAAASGHVWVRDAANPDGPMLRFSTAAWSDFIASLIHDTDGPGD